MNHFKIYLLCLGCFLMYQSCTPYKLITHTFPEPVDTSDREISIQDKKVFDISSIGVFADNMFEGARLNNLQLNEDGSIAATILPENTPINASPHYAFRIWSSQPDTIQLVLTYPGYKHRYYPKLSADGINWVPIDSSLIRIHDNKATLRLCLSENKLFVAGQELMTSSHCLNWCEKLNGHPSVTHKIIGKSELGRDFHFLDISTGDSRKKPAIAILSRQHPPEVTGYMAMEAFIGYILEDNALSNHFREKFRILVYPMMNPDGVDLGHWRHNSGGIDPNRDWSEYRQGETKLVASHMVNTLNKGKNKLLLGFDFHSTGRDIFYTLPPELPSIIHPFKDYWLQGIDATFPEYSPHDSPDPLGSPITKTWFYLQFGAEGITYEVGDHTDRDFIRAKAKVAAREMMQLLIFWK